MLALDPKRFEAALRSNIRRANALNGKVAEGAIRSTIQSGVEPKNAALTQAIKGGDKPLVDSSALFANITSKVVDDWTVFVGTLRTNKTYNVAKNVHDGMTITVTPRMRGLFFRLWKASQDARFAEGLEGRAAALYERYQGWLPLNPSTESIVIPARPYINKTFEDSGLRGTLLDNWSQAVQLSCKQGA